MIRVASMKQQPGQNAEAQRSILSMWGYKETAMKVQEEFTAQSVITQSADDSPDARALDATVMCDIHETAEITSAPSSQSSASHCVRGVDGKNATRRSTSRTSRKGKGGACGGPYLSRPALPAVDHFPDKLVVNHSNASSSSQLFPIFAVGRLSRSASRSETNDVSPRQAIIPTEAAAPPKVPVESSSRRRRITRNTSKKGKNVLSSVALLNRGSEQASLSVAHVNLDEPYVGPLEPTAGSQERPITIDSSPVKQMSPPGETEPRAQRSQTASEPSIPLDSTRPPRPRRRGTTETIVWPSALSQHVRGPQTDFVATRHTLSRKEERRSPSRCCYSGEYMHRMEDDYNRIPSRSRVRRVGALLERDQELNGLCAAHRNCLAITRFTLPMESISAQEAWSDRWRPRSAKEVLGNEVSAEYLRAWLLALAVDVDVFAETTTVGAIEKAPTANDRAANATKGGIKRPAIVRAVDRGRAAKRRRVDSDDEDNMDWIVDDDDDDARESANDNDDDDDAPPDDEISDWQMNHSDVEELSETSTQPRLQRLSRGCPVGTDNEEFSAEDTPLVDNSSPQTYDFSGYLTNSILIAGPPGIGKTAAVYACAEELGWEVFEVYPGIGKRSGANLTSLVGDVGKNHIVGRAASRVSCASPRKVRPCEEQQRAPVPSIRESAASEASKTFHAFLTSGKRNTISPDQILQRRGTEDEPIDLSMKEMTPRSPTPAVQGFGFLTAASNTTELVAPLPPLPKHAAARQSIILIEEVDILYADDVNFWPSVVNLIRDSKRPVIMTCNDPTLVPVTDLPLQTILTFSPCSPDIAVSYLQCIALAEGFKASREDMHDLYADMFAVQDVDLSDELARTTVRHDLPTCDLRRAVNNLQLACQSMNDAASPDRGQTATQVPFSGPGDIHADLTNMDKFADWSWLETDMGSEAGVDVSIPDQSRTLPDIRLVAQISEALSFVDSCVRRRPSAALGAFSGYSEFSSTDNELGHTQMNVEWATQSQDIGIPEYCQDDSIALEAVRLSKQWMRRRVTRNALGMTIQDRTEELGRLLNASELRYRRSKVLVHITNVLRRDMPTSCVQPMASLTLDYAPWVRQMIRIDDENEMAAIQGMSEEQGRRGGRMTRNSQRHGYVRWISLEEEQRRALVDAWTTTRFLG